MKALFLNCTLKKSPETSNTQAFIDHAAKEFHHLDVETESIRVVDHNVKFGNTSKEGNDDDWPGILDKVKDSDILVIATPIWRGDRSSIAKIVGERMDGLMSEGNDKNGQFPTYSKVAGVMVDGNEDGAKAAVSRIFMDVSEQGYSIPVNGFCYYVGKAGPGPSYIEAEGDKHYFTNNMMYLMVHNLVHLAKTLHQKPYQTNVNKLGEKAKSISKSEE